MASALVMVSLFLFEVLFFGHLLSHCVHCPDVSRIIRAPIPDVTSFRFDTRNEVMAALEATNTTCCDRTAGVCCRPCDSRRCSTGEFDEIVYVNL